MRTARGQAGKEQQLPPSVLWASCQHQDLVSESLSPETRPSEGGGGRGSARRLTHFPAWSKCSAHVRLSVPTRSLQRPVHHVVPPSPMTEDYLRSFRPYHTTEDLRMSSLPPLSLDPAAAAAYYHPSYLAPHPFPHPAFR